VCAIRLPLCINNNIILTMRPLSYSRRIVYIRCCYLPTLNQTRRGNIFYYYKNILLLCHIVFYEYNNMTCGAKRGLPRWYYFADRDRVARRSPPVVVAASFGHIYTYIYIRMETARSKSYFACVVLVRLLSERALPAVKSYIAKHIIQYIIIILCYRNYYIYRVISQYSKK